MSGSSIYTRRAMTKDTLECRKQTGIRQCIYVADIRVCAFEVPTSQYHAALVQSKALTKRAMHCGLILTSWKASWSKGQLHLFLAYFIQVICIWVFKTEVNHQGGHQEEGHKDRQTDSTRRKCIKETQVPEPYDHKCHIWFTGLFKQ